MLNLNLATQAKVTPVPFSQLTSEQGFAIDVARRGLSVAINAVAGSGKTYTVRAIGTHLWPKQGIYIAYNTTVAEEAKSKLPSNVSPSTFHSLAFRSIGHRYSSKIASGVPNASIIGSIDGIEDYGLPAHWVAMQIKGILNNYFNSADIDIGPEHLEKTSVKTYLAKKSMESDFNSIAISLAFDAKQVFQKMADEQDSMPVTHDFYLKLWALSKPKLAADFIMLDEAQDSNDLIIEILKSQSSQIIVVGDKYQSIYEYRNSRNAMLLLPTDIQLSLSHSFRFGQPVAEVAESVIHQYIGDADFKVIGSTDIQSKVYRDHFMPSPDAILHRKNLSVLDSMMDLQYRGVPVHIHGNVNELFRLIGAAIEFKSYGVASHPAFYGVNGWAEVIEMAKEGLNDDFKIISDLDKKYQLEYIYKGLNSVHKNPSPNSVTLSNTHKSKGFEWGNVRIYDDFATPGEEQFSEEEARLLYVAATRAINGLELNSSFPR